MATTESTPQIFTATTVLQTEKVAEGEWKVTEIKSDPPVQNEAHSANRKPFQFDLPFGLGVGGYYDYDDKEISVGGTLGGTPFGNRYTAGLSSGVTIGVDLWVAKGSIRIYGENSKLKLSYNLGAFWHETSDTFDILDL
ncbi:hypothetical protein NW762_004028 [Fusarium torreyae]|uniref:Uncharacterized protein n=1 Tax=Fusarium torreyae TaxID=1237075 RepID=A0A9W8S875_9HYPO|nr:hypothetical protein NW762_004028 [Fusarium torreyae]